MLSVTLQAVRYWKIVNFVLERTKCHVITDNERETQEGKWRCVKNVTARQEYNSSRCYNDINYLKSNRNCTCCRIFQNACTYHVT